MSDNIVKIWGVRPSLIGDTIISLPVVNYMKKKYPNSYFYFVVDKKHAHSIDLYKNNPLIDEIRITEKEDGYGEGDLEIMKSCDIVFDCRPPSLHPYWWNFKGLNLITTNWMMADLPLEDYFEMPKEMRYPRLYRWWDKKPMSGDKNISLWPIANYDGKDGLRNPTIEQWEYIVSKLIEEGYTIHQFGWHENPSVGIGENFYNWQHLSFMDQIKKSLDCNMIFGIESGATWATASYGEIPQLNLLIMSDHQTHIDNPYAWHPTGKKSKSFCVQDKWSNLDKDKLIDFVKKTK